MKIVIICGGYGSKMWPASRQSKPKHFLPLVNGKSLFELNWESLRKKFKPEEIFLQTQDAQAKIAKALVPEILSQNIFIEPEMKNQGVATGFSAAMFYRLNPDEPFMLIQVDDIREPEEKLFEMMDICDKLARETGKYITGGFKPDFAVTGNDWLIKGDRITKTDEVGVYKVEKFLWRGEGEKAKLQAEEYLKQGKALLHTNHTCMTPRNFLEMFKKYKLEWYQPLMNIALGGDIETEFAKLPPGPLEDVTQLVHAAGESLVVEIPFDWIDFGTWENLSKYFDKKKWTKYDTDVIDIDSKNNLVRADKNKVVALIGVSDLVVVDTGDAILICREDQSGRVGEVVNVLKEKGKTDLL